MTTWDFLKNLNKDFGLMSRERNGRATNSELKRWCQNKAVVVNGQRMEFDCHLPVPIKSFVLFPKNPVTLF